MLVKKRFRKSLKGIKRKGIKRKGIKRILFYLGLFFLCLIPFSIRWGIATFGNVSMDEIIFTLHMPLKGASTDVFKEFVQVGLMPAIEIWLLFYVWINFPVNRILQIQLEFRGKRKKIQLLPLKFSERITVVLCLGLFALELFQVNRAFSVKDYILAQIQKSNLFETEYVSADEVQLIFPEKKRNLICLYMESAESSNQDRGNGGVFSTNYIPEMTQLAKENVSFSQSDLIEGSVMPPGATWTMGGLIAETSGVPLKVPSTAYYNTMGNKESFLPGIVTLGEVLAKEGYKNYFFAGSDFSFGGRRSFFTQHGDYTIYDYVWAKKTGKIPQDYRVWWGFEDAKLYEFVKEKLLELEETEEPFFLSFLTVDTHTPAGYVCQLCENNYSRQYENVWACASRQVYDFVEWCKKQDFYENTTIVISGDHVSMDGAFYPADTQDSYLGEGIRKVYNAFVNPVVEPLQEKNRKFTTLDMYPTILGSIGVEIQGNRLGLGTNLFSSEKTLSEKYGYREFFKELNKKSDYYNKNLLYSK